MMITNNKCLISLDELSHATREQGEYSRLELRNLVGSIKNQMQLSFTRREFATVEPQKQQGLSISGFQPKLSLSIVDRKFAVVGSHGEYILKPSPEQFPNLAENEHATMMVMKNLGFDVPPFGLTRFAKDENGDQPLAFIIKRFDRDKQGNSIHQEQLDAAMGVPDKYGKIGHDDEGYVSYEQIGRFLTKNIDSSLKMKQEFFKRVLWANILGNNDLHLRNFGILIPEKSANKLSPVYDYVSVAPYGGYLSPEDCLALPLLVSEEGNNKTTNGFRDYSTYTGGDFRDLGESLGLRQPMIGKIFDDTIKSKDLVIDTYNRSFMERSDVAKVIDWIESRYYYLTR